MKKTNTNEFLQNQAEACGPLKRDDIFIAMLVNTVRGLFCPAGNFYIDPCRGVDHAVVTHAHSDHARRGSKNYYTARCGVGVLKNRLGPKILVHPKDYGEVFSFNGIKVSLHPAGHILGSAQVRIDDGHQVWVVSGDYKRDNDPTCEAYEVVKCDVFITEATFGTPAFRWNKTNDVGREIHKWREENQRAGVNSILFAYSLGKAQRVLANLKKFSNQPVYCHPSVYEMSECYRQEGIDLPPLRTLSEELDLRGELILTPPSFFKSEAGHKILRNPYQTAFASGWMAQHEHGYDRGFLMSDHADWDDLLLSVEQSEAKKIYVLHRGSGALVRHLRRLGLEAHPISKLDENFSTQTSLL